MLKRWYPWRREAPPHFQVDFETETVTDHNFKNRFATQLHWPSILRETHHRNCPFSLQMSRHPVECPRTARDDVTCARFSSTTHLILLFSLKLLASENTHVFLIFLYTLKKRNICFLSVCVFLGLCRNCTAVSLNIISPVTVLFLIPPCSILMQSWAPSWTGRWVSSK